MLNKLERKYGRYAIPRLSVYIVIAYIAGYILQFVAPNVLSLLLLDPYKILHGQVWRIVTWAFMPPYSMSLFTVINLFFIYSIGSTMEKMWGDFRFNVYVFGGMLFCVAGAFILYGVEALTGVLGSEIFGMSGFSAMMAPYFTTYYINASMIMAFAMSLPEARVMLYFIIPIKMKYFAYIELFFVVIDLVVGNPIRRCVIILSMLNFAIFYFSGRKTATTGRAYRSGYGKNASFKKRPADPGRSNVTEFRTITRHKCAICGRTEVTNPELEFRFCSKCNGNYEYCSEHLYTHDHID